MIKIYLTALLTGFCYLVFSQDITAEKILENYYQANGKEKFLSVNTIIQEGYRVRNDIMPVTYYRMRPDKYLMKYDLADLTAYRVYDGETAWYTAPWRGLITPELFPEEHAEAFISSVDFDPVLYTWEAKAYSINFIGKEKLSDVEHYILELTNNTNGQVVKYFIHTDTYMLTKTSTARESEEGVSVTETFFSDYREVEGMMFHFMEETYTNGTRVLTIEFEEIIINPEMNSDFFKMESHFEMD